MGEKKKQEQKIMEYSYIHYNKQISTVGILCEISHVTTNQVLWYEIPPNQQGTMSASHAAHHWWKPTEEFVLVQHHVLVLLLWQKKQLLSPDAKVGP